MKIGLYTDSHITMSSSIVLGKTGTFNGRLENMIESFDWANEEFKRNQCDTIVNLGDTVDKSSLEAEEISALKLCHIDDHIILLGNHERVSENGKLNSINMYDHVIIEPQFLNDQIFLLPYSKKPLDLSSYKLDKDKTIILSHNDIKGIMYGDYLTTIGYEIPDILNNCRLFINGHIHQGKWIYSKRILDLGLLSGLNFSTTDSDWNPGIAILDTDNFSVKFIENPKAFIFHKATIYDQTSLLKFLDKLPRERNNIVQIKVPYDLADSCRKLLESKPYVIHSRILTFSNDKNSIIDSDDNVLVLKQDKRSGYDKFREYISSKESLPVSKDLINDELKILEEMK